MTTESESDAPGIPIVEVSRLKELDAWKYQDHYRDALDFAHLERYLHSVRERINILVEEFRKAGIAINRWSPIIALVDPQDLEAIRGQIVMVKQDLEETHQRVLALDQDLRDVRNQETIPAMAKQDMEEVRQRLQSLDRDLSAVQSQLTSLTSGATALPGKLTAHAAKIDALQEEVQQLKAYRASIPSPIAEQPANAWRGMGFLFWSVLLLALGLGAANMGLWLLWRH